VTDKLDRIIQGDCVKQLAMLDAGSIDLAFADPPFNIGYDYDEYDDRQTAEDYLAWSKLWIEGVIRVLKPTGTLWLAIGDEYAAELKVLATRELGLTCRSWVVWYYTFGVHCKTKFTRSHAHLFYFVRDSKAFTFNDMPVRVPSARQLVYGDKRADPKGRVPDDTWLIRPTPHESWILRPQDLPEGFTADGDTWYYPRVCGTFKERMGFHGCQMPEQLLGRIIKACSNEGDVVLDPFTGSGTTLAVARKLGRRYLGIELSKQYATESRNRLERSKPGDSLDGFEDPLTTVPNTANGTIRTAEGKRMRPNDRIDTGTVDRLARPPTGAPRTRRPRRVKGLDDVSRGILEAFVHAHRGFSTDRVIADPDLNDEFTARCSQLALPGTPGAWNLRLMGMRKAKQLGGLKPLRATIIPPDELDQCEFGSEIAMAILTDEHHVSPDSLLSTPKLVREFDATARRFAPGKWSVLHYRWAALRIRKRPKKVAALRKDPPRSLQPIKFGMRKPVRQVDPKDLPDAPNIYLIGGADNTRLYVGETENLRRRFVSHFRNGGRRIRWPVPVDDMTFSLPRKQEGLSTLLDSRRHRQEKLHPYQISRLKPQWNLARVVTPIRS